MFYILNRTSGQPTYPIYRGQVEKCYSLLILAELDAEKVEEATHLKTARIDVVEISRSARLYLENQARLIGEPK
jgi:hypothetical protein